MIKRLILCTAIAAVLSYGLLPIQNSRAAELTIGSEAPSLDIEHWLQDGNGFFKPVEEFEEGKVYVVEFWATWCGPCIMSMPHLAELQQKYRDEGVQIISITDETVDEVKDLMGQKHPQDKKTFGEITSAYSLTADPDRSAHQDYMEASGARGIPTAYIVGKTGEIEWTGHPMSMDEPLAKVIDDTWDRKAFKKELEIQQQLEENMQQMARLAGKGKFGDALELVVEFEEGEANEMIQNHWTNIRHSLKMVSGKLDDDTIDYYREQLASMKKDKDLQSMLQFGNELFGFTQQDAKIGPLGRDVLAAIEEYAEDNKIPEGMEPLHYNTIALLSEVEGNYKKAAEAQSAAIDASSPRQARRMMPYLEELQAKARAAEARAAEARGKKKEGGKEKAGKKESDKKEPAKDEKG